MSIKLAHPAAQPSSSSILSQHFLAREFASHHAPLTPSTEAHSEPPPLVGLAAAEKPCFATSLKPESSIYHSSFDPLACCDSDHSS
jgi:hypothetical protein